MKYTGHIVKGLEFLSDTEMYQVLMNGKTCLITAFGFELKALLWERDSLFILSFACLNIGKH